MSDPSQPNETGAGAGSTYGFDPFGGQTQARWGRRAKSDAPLPQIPGYEVVDHLGSGGMGSVWSARFLALNQLRAVKLLDRSLARDPLFLERFGQEAKALGRLDHPNIVKVYDANAEHDPPYIAMDWVEGKTLTEILGGKPMPVREAIPLLSQIAAALDYAHGNGFIHRDLKPSNIMVTREGKAMLIDFGVTSWLGSEVGEGHTLTGTTRYLSPEVIQGRPVTTSSDLWAFAVIIYRVLTGTLPFDGKDGDSVLASIVREDPKEPPSVPTRVARYLLHLLQKDPALRAKSAKAMVDGLRRVANPLEAIPGGGDPGRLALMGAAAVAFLAIVAVIATKSGKSTPVAKTETPAAIPLGKGGKSSGTDDGGSGTDAPSTAIKPWTGVWYADLGTRFAEVTLDAAGKNRLSAVWHLRGTDGEALVNAEGSLSDDGKTLTLTDQGKTGGDATPGLETFVGKLSSDGARIAGTRGPADGSPIQAILVRSGDIATTPYANDPDGFNLQIPTSWTAESSQTGELRMTEIHPIGVTNVGIRITVAPEPNARPLEDIIAETEASLPNYARGTYNPDASLAGRRGASVDYRLDQTPTIRGTKFLTYRGSNTLSIDAYLPVPDEAIWAPIIEKVRGSLRIGG